jgi:RIO-like serine/threonine protein kinase
MFGNKAFVFAEDVLVEERLFIQDAIHDAICDDREILKGHHSAKRFFRMESAGRQFFIKAREFASILRRLGRTVRKTKEEEEFRNYLLLREHGVPCPDPVASARLYSGPLVSRSLLLTEYLPRAVTLRQFLTGEGDAGDAFFEALFAFLLDLKEKGFIHEDLQWNNILVENSRGAFQFLVIDALHVRFVQGLKDEEFLKTLMWFSEFMKREHAPRDLHDRFLKMASSW